MLVMSSIDNFCQRHGFRFLFSPKRGIGVQFQFHLHFHFRLWIEVSLKIGFYSDPPRTSWMPTLKSTTPSKSFHFTLLSRAGRVPSLSPRARARRPKPKDPSPKARAQRPNWGQALRTASRDITTLISTSIRITSAKPYSNYGQDESGRPSQSRTKIRIGHPDLDLDPTRPDPIFFEILSPSRYLTHSYPTVVKAWWLPRLEGSAPIISTTQSKDELVVNYPIGLDAQNFGPIPALLLSPLQEVQLNFVLCKKIMFLETCALCAILKFISESSD